MTPVAEALSAALLHFVWQGIVGVVLLGIALLVLKKSSPGTRYLASCVALAALALSPLVTAWITVQPASLATETPAVASGRNLSSIVVSSVSESAPATPIKGIYPWILPLWAAGVFVFALRLAWAGGHASSLRRRAVRADSSVESIVAKLSKRLGVRRRLRVLMSSIAEVPSVVGWIRPVILLPAAVATGLTPYQLEALIAHEIAHIRRYDYLVNILQMIVETVLFYHPAVWWVSSRIRYERELCCDDLAVRSCGDAVSYARALAQLEKLRPAAPGLVMGSANGPLLYRIQRLLGTVRSESGPSKLGIVVGLLGGMLFLGLILNTARAQQREVPTVPSPQNRVPAVGEVPPIPPTPPALAAPIPPTPPALAAPIPPTPPVPPLSVPAVPASAAAPAVPAIAVPSTLPASPSRALPAVPRTAAVAVRAPAFPQDPSLPVAPRWVLFRGNDVIVRASATDEEQARKARASFTGDLLWFQLEGKAYVTQDKETLVRMQAATANSADGPTGTSEIAAALERLNQQLSEVSRFVDQRQTLQDLHVTMAQMQERLSNSQRAPQNVEELRQQFAQLEATNARMQSLLAQREAEIRRMEAQIQAMESRRRLNAEREGELEALQRVLDILQSAVRTGRAQVAP